ncbi:hypothetical protein RHMOL_Rhmol11G0223200 [Rhododendron molle]|uniref:Uncharacterized protein n=1 Tax=Rhododendron molle TaxID=49168 RepID=A0ACC0LV73_RHOML|nr:hypothetical protein RHMOL_Rhmol11G0223200 [Rhododendron molle]
MKGLRGVRTLQKAIWNSSMSVIALSKTYATSKSCLFEIETILEHRKKKSDHVILPVFYEVDPSEIKEQAKKLNSGEKKVTVEEVEGWSAALKEVASMAGMVSGNHSNRFEVKFIEEIIGVLKSKQADNQYLRDLDENMQNLKRKVEYLSGQENDITYEIRSAECRPLKRPKNEVEVWLADVQRFKDNVQRLEQEVVGESNVWNVISCVRLGKRIMEKVQEAEDLQEKRKSFNDLLVDECPTGGLLMPPTKDFVESTEARNVERVWECLMNDDVRQIGVYGMGGVGKTTIMKQIHNWILKQKDKFDGVFWVTASKAFNVLKLQSDIAKELNFSLSDDKDEGKRAMHLYAALSRRKKYVLIIDDLWDAFPLERVGIPEPTQSNGCKIVLTTRSLGVCKSMDCTDVKVELLTQQEALTLFVRKAGRNGTVLAPEVEEIATEIAKRCSCLPLAVVTIARSLRALEGTHEWRDALNDLISSRKDTRDAETEVFEILKYSYDRLGNKVLQDCFLYCSLYPEDHLIRVNGLIEYWIAEELIADMESVERQFDKGHAILAKLKSSCLLESGTSMFGQEWVRMHDSIRDMALRITASSPRFMVKAGEIITSVPYEPWSEDLERISFMDSLISELPITPPVCRQLTTLLLNCDYKSMLEVIPDSFFTNMPCLEVLDLSLSRIMSLPVSISNLKNLHALILGSCTQLKYVPSLEKLKALKKFVLTNSKIEELPEGIEELVNLRKLILAANFDIKRMFPSWKLRRLSKLHYLRIDGTGIEVSDLQCLSQLKVVVVQFHNVQELTRYAISQQFQGLHKYGLIVGNCVVYENNCDVCEDNLGREVRISSESVPLGSAVDQLVLPAGTELFGLEGFHNPFSLSAIPCFKDAKYKRKFVVKHCHGLESIFSSSTFLEDGHFSLGTVEEFDLAWLPRFRVLFDGIAPPHNIYFNLKTLHINQCNAVKNIFPVQLLQNFPNLKSLSVVRCKYVEDIIVEIAETSDRGHHQDYSNLISLPKLENLELRHLPRLKSIYNGVMVCPSIVQVDVYGCPMVRRLPLSLPMDGEQATPPPALKEINAQKEWWDSLEWDDPLTKTILQPFYTDYYPEDSDDDYFEDSDDDYSVDLDDDYSEDSDDELIDLNKSPDRTVDLLSSMSSDSIHLNKRAPPLHHHHYRHYTTTITTPPPPPPLHHPPPPPLHHPPPPPLHHYTTTNTTTTTTTPPPPLPPLHHDHHYTTTTALITTSTTPPPSSSPLHHHRHFTTTTTPHSPPPPPLPPLLIHHHHY